MTASSYSPALKWPEADVGMLSTSYASVTDRLSMARSPSTVYWPSRSGFASPYVMDWSYAVTVTSIGVIFARAVSMKVNE